MEKVAAYYRNIYLPKYSQCTLKFVMAILKGKKKAFLNSEVKRISVRKLRELSA